MSLAQRMDDPEYKNWLKSGLALILLNESLQPFSNEELTKFHKYLKGNSKIQQLEKCTTCNERIEPSDDCKICSGWKAVILEKHINPQGTHWANVDPKLWPTSELEVAKVFMPKGQKPGKYARDISSVLNLMSNCKIFRPNFSSKVIGKVIKIRNDIMHSNDMKVTKGDLENQLGIILELFKQLFKIKKDVEPNMQCVEELKNCEFNIWLEGDHNVTQGASSKPARRLQQDGKQQEMELITQWFKELEQRLVELSNQNKLELHEFFNHNNDLNSKFKDELTNLFPTQMSDVEGGRATSVTVYGNDNIVLSDCKGVTLNINH